MGEVRRGSGIQQVLCGGKFLQWTIDSDSTHFDLVSFDPRGVSYSVPDASCFSDPRSRDVWNIRTNDEGILDIENRAPGLQWPEPNHSEHRAPMQR